MKLAEILAEAKNETALTKNESAINRLLAGARKLSEDFDQTWRSIMRNSSDTPQPTAEKSPDKTPRQVV